MAMFRSTRAVWSLSIISIIFIKRISCDQRYNSGSYHCSYEDIENVPCPKECQCYSWSSNNVTQRGDRFIVNCTSMELRYHSRNILKSLPFNTTDLLVSNFLIDTLNRESFDRDNILGPNLTSLVLRECHIGYISEHTFTANTVQGLHHLDLSENIIKHIHKLAFIPLQNIRTISLANNSIQKIERLEFKKSNQVKLINISHNMLTEVNPGTFYHVPRLKVLDLSYNNLKTLPWDNISQQLPSLEVLDLTGNPWNCSCEMKDVLKLNRSLLNESRAKCFDPLRLYGILLEDLNSDTFSECYITEKYFEITHTMLLTVLLCITSLFSMYLLAMYLFLVYYIRYICERIAAAFPTLISLLDLLLSFLIKKRRRRIVGQISYNLDDPLDQSENVYKGGLKDGRKAAIKKHHKVEIRKELEIFLLLKRQARPHPNIIQYLYVEHDSNFTYLALELCEGNLMTAVIDDPLNCISQLTSAVCFLHDKNIQHRDIKPQNILWKKTVDGIAFILSDFDLSKLGEEPSSHKVKCGTRGWSAPELWGQETRSTAVDIFSLGCVFHFILTRGHPFGAISDLKECQDNIMSPEYKPTLAELYEHHSEHEASMVEDLIRRMICSNAADRIQSHKIREHPFFWFRV
ncbi:serine threonine- kinase endoribonuclease IRE1-like isoform X1 [Paramuricea clavata]|uniref:Serine threonine- kinase endoribonuclease IRE1-like isoform X1 n=1 Tax=Paramuricea clavata TaxID=317549 RepID=A0A7D9I9B2_PARCT|nr:serine threonine- kinase endoribonuclease IRE1-like isoform X1 [Paramuricea clavata]